MNKRIFGSNLLKLVALRIEFLPEHVLQFLDTLSGNRRDEDHRKIGRQSFLEHFNQFFVEQIALGNSQHAMLVEHLWIEVLQFAQQYFIFFLDVVSIARNHEEQQRVALNMAEESQAQTFSFARALDDARNISHDKTLVIAIIYDTQRWFERSKRIVCNLRTGT